MEDESPAGAKARRAKHIRRWAIEVSLACAFVIAVSAADHFLDNSPPSQLFAAISVAAASVIFALWFVIYYAAFHKSYDEFERNLELRAVAVAGGAVVWFAVAWGLAEKFLTAPHFPMVMLAPIYSIAYAVVWLIISRTYR